jgi:hypothetical protein
VILHPLAEHEFVLVVVAVAELDIAVGADIGDGGNVLEEIGKGRVPMADWAAR